MGANDGQTVKALIEAESYDGPSLVIAYAHCIAHGIEMSQGLEQQKKAVACGHWPLYRFDPRRAARGENPLQIDSKPPSISFTDYAYAETRFRSLELLDPHAARELARRIMYTDKRRERIEKEQDLRAQEFIIRSNQALIEQSETKIDQIGADYRRQLQTERIELAVQLERAR